MLPPRRAAALRPRRQIEVVVTSSACLSSHGGRASLSLQHGCYPRRELAHIALNLIPHPAEDFAPLLRRPLDSGRINVAPMKQVASKRPHRATFLRVIRKRNHKRKIFLEQLLYVLRLVFRNVDSHSLHPPRSERV